MLGLLQNSKDKIAVKTLTLKHSLELQGKVILSCIDFYFHHTLRVNMMQISFFGDKFHLFITLKLCFSQSFFAAKYKLGQQIKSPVNNEK